MDSVIDSLSLKIGIDIEKGIDKTISSLAKSISQLNRAVEDADVKGLKTYVNTLSKFTTTNIKVSMPTISSGNMGNVAEIKNVLETTKVAVDSATPSLQESAKAISNIRLQTSKTVKSLESMNTELRKTGKSAKSNSKDLDLSSKSFSKLVRSIGRIAFYRAVRTAVSAVAKAFKEGIENYVQYNEATNTAMSNTMNSINQLKNTLGVTAGSVMQVLSPVIISLTNSVTDLINNLNLAMASISGKDTYSKAIKQNEDYAKSLDKTKSKLLSFDKFEVLNTGDEKTNPSEMFEEVKVPDELTEIANIFKDIISAVNEVWNTLKKLFEKIKPLIKPVIDVLLVSIQIATQLIDILSQSLDGFVEFVGGILQQIEGALQMVSGLLMLLTSDFDGAWEKIANGFANMVNGIANMFIGLVNTITGLLNIIIKPFLSIFGIDWEIPRWEAEVNWQPYADGGNFSKGTAFYAGEAGAEIVYNKRTGSSAGGVLNIEQFTTAMVDALTIYGASQGNMSGFDGLAVYLDKNKVGQVVEDSVYSEGVRVGHFTKR